MENTRIGVFYDGNFLYHISNYYAYHHPRKARLSIPGLHYFVRWKVAAMSGMSDAQQCQITEAHYFRGRLIAKDAVQNENLLYRERVFDDVLSSSGVETHYLPMRSGYSHSDKGVEILMALEMLERAYHERFDVIVVIASDGSYSPAVRKLNTFGIPTVLLAWDVEFQDDMGNDRQTRTSQELIEVSSHPIMMHEVVDEPEQDELELIDELFVRRND